MPITSIAQIFSTPVKTEDLDLAFQSYRELFEPRTAWFYANKFSAYLHVKNIPLEHGGEQALADFLAEAKAAGVPFSDHQINTLRRKNEQIKAANPQAAVLAIDPPPEHQGVRKLQLANSSERMQAEFKRYRIVAEKTVARRSHDASERLMLRLLALAEEGGAEISSLRQLWDDRVIKILDACCYGKKGITDWREDETARKDRAEFLYIGGRYARDVLGADEMDLRLVGHIEPSIRERNMPWPIADAVKTFKDLTRIETIKKECFEAVRAFRARPGDDACALAQTAASMLVQIATCRGGACVVTTGKFDGPKRRIPGTDQERPLLTLTVHRRRVKKPKARKQPPDRVIKVEEEMLEATRIVFDQLWLSFKETYGYAPFFLNEKPREDLPWGLRAAQYQNANAKTRSASAYSTGVKRFGQRVDFVLSPEILQLGVVVALKQAGVRPKDIARALGISQRVNFMRSFKDVLGSGIAQQFADAIDKSGELECPS